MIYKSYWEQEEIFFVSVMIRSWSGLSKHSISMQKIWKQFLVLILSKTGVFFFGFAVPRLPRVIDKDGLALLI